MKAWTDLEVRAELWLAAKVGIADLYAGVTTRETRRERIRAQIVSNGWAQRVVGRGPDGKVECLESVFRRLYGEAL